MKNECNLIRDLLPLYYDEVCSTESRNAVEEHLGECEDCRQYYEQVKSAEVVENVVYDDEKEKKKAKFFKALKKKVIFVIFTVMWRSLLLLGYLGVCGLFIYSMSHCINQFLYEKINLQGLVVVLIALVIIPIGALFFSFRKQRKKVWVRVQIGVQILMIPYLCYMLLAALLLPMALLQSHTTDIDNYGVFDEDVAEHIEQMGTDIMPQSLPENIEQVEYSYDYMTTFDSVLDIEAKWRYVLEEDYEQVKNEILDKRFAEIHEKFIETYEENGYIMTKYKYYNQGNTAEFGYNDETNSVIFRIDGAW